MTEHNSNAGMSCATKCRLAGIVIGILIAWALWAQADYLLWIALLIGVLVALLGGWVMAHFFCADSHHDAYDVGTPTGTTSAVELSDIRTGAGSTPTSAAPDMAETVVDKERDAATAPLVKGDSEDASSKAPKKAETKSPQATVKPAARTAESIPAVPTAEREVDARDVPVMDRGRELNPVVDMAPEDMPATSLLDMDQPGQASLDDGRLQETAQDSVVEAQRKSAPAQPLMYTSAPETGADDLKRISGVGPKLEGVLNDMGVYTFAQVASWKAEDIAWVDERLKFKGRITRDNWVAQAKTLAEG